MAMQRVAALVAAAPALLGVEADDDDDFQPRRRRTLAAARRSPAAATPQVTAGALTASTTMTPARPEWSLGRRPGAGRGRGGCSSLLLGSLSPAVFLDSLPFAPHTHTQGTTADNGLPARRSMASTLAGRSGASPPRSVTPTMAAAAGVPMLVGTGQQQQRRAAGRTTCPTCRPGAPRTFPSRSLSCSLLRMLISLCPVWPSPLRAQPLAHRWQREGIRAPRRQPLPRPQHHRQEPEGHESEPHARDVEEHEERGSAVAPSSSASPRLQMMELRMGNLCDLIDERDTNGQRAHDQMQLALDRTERQLGRYPFARCSTRPSNSTSNSGPW